MNARFLAAALAVASLGESLSAETVKDREGAVRQDRATMEEDARWIYNDVDRGFVEAGRTGKPLLVVLRCVPCLACKGIDASILASPELRPLLDQFVCVRVINANKLDLGRFQFDYDLSFSTLFFNADGTVYGRFGSWRHQRDSQDSTTAGYKAALGAVMTIHRDYPANRESLAAKQGGPAPFKIPVEIPALAGKYGRELDWQGKVAPSCVHCHQIGDAFRTFYRDQGKPVPTELIYPMPAPETIGLGLDAEYAARVLAVAAGSPAAAAGLRPGDDLVSVNGQPLVSVADLAWALHRLPEPGTLALRIRRGTGTEDLTVTLPEGWRFKTDISTRVGTWGMRAMAAGGLQLEDLPDVARQQRGLGRDDLALLVKHVGAYGAHAAAKNAGFQKDDVLIAVDGLSGRLTESEFIGRVLVAHPGKTQLKAAVLRGSQRLDLQLPIQ